MSSRRARLTYGIPVYKARCCNVAQGVELGWAPGALRAVWSKCAIDSTKIGAANSFTEQTMVRALLQQQKGLQSKDYCTSKSLVH